jgi:hypothetical protein
VHLSRCALSPQEAAGAMVFALLRAADQAESTGKARYQSLARLYSR